MNKEFKPYKRIFEDELEEDVFDEACPEGSKERNGQCAKKDNSGYLRGTCPVGNVWDDKAGSVGKCIPHTKK